MRDYADDYLVKCPFYAGDKKTSIRCTGTISDFQVNYFSSKAAMKEHKEDFCKACYQGCPLYEIIWEKEEEKVQQ